MKEKLNTFALFLLCLLMNSPVQSSVFYYSTLGKAGTPPSALSLAHAANSKSFTVSWVAGAGNGGSNGCRIEYQKSDLSWVSLKLANCDNTGASVGTVTLPADNWYGTSWSTVPIRLIRVSDSAVIGSLGNLTCVGKAASAASTPSVDEDCNDAWDNSTSQVCSVTKTVYASFTNGTSYSFNATENANASGFYEEGGCGSYTGTVSFYNVTWYKLATKEGCGNLGGVYLPNGLYFVSSGTIPNICGSSGEDCTITTCTIQGNLYRWQNPGNFQDGYKLTYRTTLTSYR